MDAVGKVCSTTPGGTLGILSGRYRGPFLTGYRAKKYFIG